MLRKTESAAAEEPTKRWATQQGIWHRKMNGRGQRSWPDTMFLIPGGKPFFIEFKRVGKGPTPKQAENHKKLRGLGYDIEVHDDKDEAIASLERRLEAAQLPKAWNTVPPSASELRAAVGSGSWKDEYRARGYKDAQERRNAAQDANHRAKKADASRVASRTKKVERLP